MKTEQEIKAMCEVLDKKRINSLADRDNAKNDFDRSVAQNLVLVYAMQHNILLEVLDL